MYLKIYMHTYMCVYVNVRICLHIYTYVYTCMHAYIPTYIHTYVHTYPHTYMQFFEYLMIISRCLSLSQVIFFVCVSPARFLSSRAVFFVRLLFKGVGVWGPRGFLPGALPNQDSGFSVGGVLVINYVCYVFSCALGVDGPWGWR